jgi:hypothetical protein
MNLKQFDKLTPRDFENGAVINDIRKVFMAIEIIAKHNRIKNDLEAYLYEVYLWAIEGGRKPDPKHYGLTDESSHGTRKL